MPQNLFKLQGLPLVAICVAGLTACASKPSSQITLLPNSDGRVTSVLVTTAKGSQVLD